MTESFFFWCGPGFWENYQPKQTMDDIFGSDDEMKTSGTRVVSNALYKAGYRDGKGKEEDRQMQLGFDESFSNSIQIGKICGAAYGLIKSSSQDTVIDESLYNKRRLHCEAILNDLLSIPTIIDVEGKIPTAFLNGLRGSADCFPEAVTQQFFEYIKMLESISY